MILSKYLIINNRGSVQLRERTFSLKHNEVAIKLEMDIPDALFTKPTLVATMTIPEEAVPQSQIDTKVTDNIEKIIKDATGLTMNISVVEHPVEAQE